MYVGTVITLAAVAGGVWVVIDAARAVDVVTSVLIVTCRVRSASRHPLRSTSCSRGFGGLGVFVRRSSLLDRARAVRRVVFDKTGTLTWGGVTVDELRPVDPALTDLLYTMTASSNHPVSRAIAAHLAPRKPRFLAHVPVDEIPGCGLIAVHDGHEFRLGSSRFTLGDADRYDDHMCVLTRDARVESCFAVDEDYRAGAREELEGLAAAGYETWIASGGSRRPGSSRGRAVGVFERPRARRHVA